MTLFSKPSLIILLGGLMMASLDAASMNVETRESHDPRALASFIPTPADLDARNFFAAAEAVKNPATKGAALLVLVKMMENKGSSVVLRESALQCILQQGKPHHVMYAHFIVLTTPQLFPDVMGMLARGPMDSTRGKEVARYLVREANELYFWLSGENDGQGHLNPKLLNLIKTFETTHPDSWLGHQEELTDWRSEHYGPYDKFLPLH